MTKPRHTEYPESNSLIRKSTFKHGLMAGAVVLFSIPAATVAESPVFIARFLPPVESESVATVALGVNTQVQVVGFEVTASGLRGVLWRAPDVPIQLGDLPGGTEHSVARGINDNGVVVGESGAADADTAAIWYASSEYQPARLPAPQGQAAATPSRAVAVNLHNQIAGSSGDFSNRRATVWASSQPSVLALPSAHVTASDLSAINNLGAVVGRAATSTGTTGSFFAEPSGGMRALIAIGEGLVIANDVNGSSTAVGSVRTPNRIPASVSQLRPVKPLHDVRPMLWMGALYPGDLRVVSGSPVRGEANAVNEGGDIVGVGYVDSGARAYMWSARYGAVDLNEVVGDISPYVLVSAYAISERGVIVGAAVNTEDRTTRAFMLTPM
jgi:uncharacterized membrane protein